MHLHMLFFFVPSTNYPEGTFRKYVRILLHIRKKAFVR